MLVTFSYSHPNAYSIITTRWEDLLQEIQNLHKSETKFAETYIKSKKKKKKKKKNIETFHSIRPEYWSDFIYDWDLFRKSFSPIGAEARLVSLEGPTVEGKKGLQGWKPDELRSGNSGL